MKKVKQKKYQAAQNIAGKISFKNRGILYSRSTVIENKKYKSPKYPHQFIKEEF